MEGKSILIVGAGGFIGGFIARRALELGYETWAGIRETTSRRWLDDPRLRFAVFDYDNPDALREQVARYAAEVPGGCWTHIIWNLGATKAVNYRDFDRVNFGYVRSFVNALAELNLRPERFLYMSSLSALGPGDEQGYTPLDEHTIAMPNTAYGLSKIKAETFLETQAWLPWIIFRPTGVYGPHEKDYLMMIKSIDSHFDFGVGYRKQMLTFIYVDDLVEAMFRALNASDVVVHKKYIISEPRAYTQSEFRDMVTGLLGNRFVIPVRLPLWTAKIASAVAEKFAAARGKSSTLNRDKYKIMRQRNWSCDITPARRDFGFNPEHSLLDGLRATVAAYRADQARARLDKANRLGIR